MNIRMWLFFMSLLSAPALMFLVYRMMGSGGFLNEDTEVLLTKIAGGIIAATFIIYLVGFTGVYFFMLLLPVIVLIVTASILMPAMVNYYRKRYGKAGEGGWICRSCGAENDDIFSECGRCGVKRDNGKS